MQIELEQPEKIFWTPTTIAVAALVCVAAAGYGWFKTSPSTQAKNVVIQRLNDPDSAEFRNHRQATRGGAYVWCGEVNARNRMGGMVGYTRYVVEMDHIGRSHQVHFDQGQGSFGGKWQLMCES